MRQYVLAAVLFVAAAAPASAYTSYLKPDEFWTGETEVRVEGSYATQFFTPTIALGAELTLLNPAGERVGADRIAVTGNSTELEADLTRGGTYRVSTGEVTGQVANLVGENGTWRVLGANEVPPEGAETTTLQTVTVADTYITRGAATRDALDESIGRLAIRPVTHPNQVLASQGFEIELLFDGQPMANSAVVIYSAGDPETKLDRYVVTNEQGRATFTFDEAGQYIIAARHRADLPPGSEAEVGSYTTTLTFEALDTLYADIAVQDVVREEVRPDQRERPRPRRRAGRQDR